jgi:DNA-binding NtrC family response regulator
MLLDHKMGGMTGLDVLANSPKRRDMLVIMITAFATIETAVRATKSGAFDFIAKPFTPDELKDTVRKAASHLLSHRQARRLAEEKRKRPLRVHPRARATNSRRRSQRSRATSTCWKHRAGDDIKAYERRHLALPDPRPGACASSSSTCST